MVECTSDSCKVDSSNLSRPKYEKLIASMAELGDALNLEFSINMVVKSSSLFWGMFKNLI